MSENVNYYRAIVMKAAMAYLAANPATVRRSIEGWTRKQLMVLTSSYTGVPHAKLKEAMTALDQWIAEERVRREQAGEEVDG